MFMPLKTSAEILRIVKVENQKTRTKKTTSKLKLGINSLLNLNLRHSTVSTSRPILSNK